MKDALAGIATAWAFMGAVFGTIWMFDNYPETAWRLALAVFVTIWGAIMGLSITH